MDAGTRAVREWLLDRLSEEDRTTICKWGERVPNEVNQRLNEAAVPDHPDAMMVPAQLVARALIARGILNVAADWWASIPGQPCRAMCLSVLTSLVEELPPWVEGGSYIPGQPESPEAAN